MLDDAAPTVCTFYLRNRDGRDRSRDDVVYLEIGDRTKGDEGSYPNDDIKAVMGADGKWALTHKDGTPY